MVGQFEGNLGAHALNLEVLVSGFWDDHWVYWLGPLIGGGLAALVYYLTFMRGREEE